MDDNFGLFGRIGYVLLPLRLVYLINGPKLRFRCLLRHLLHPFSSPLLHEGIVVVKVNVVLSCLLDLFVVPSELGVVQLVVGNCCFVYLFCCGLFLNCFPVAHLDLDVFPFGGDSARHEFYF